MSDKDWLTRQVYVAEVVRGVASGSGEWALKAAKLGFDEHDYDKAAEGIRKELGDPVELYWGVIDALADLQISKQEPRPRNKEDVDLVLASVMDTDMNGLHELMLAVLGGDRLTDVLERARPGEFSLKRWLFWSKKLSTVHNLEEALPMPRRFPIKLEELGPFDEAGVQLALHRGDREVWETLRDACRASQKLDETVTRICEDGGVDPWGRESLRAWLIFVGKRTLDEFYGD